MIFELVESFEYNGSLFKCYECKGKRCHLREACQYDPSYPGGKRYTRFLIPEINYQISKHHSKK